jgi:MurNAc alpha-1-phosphate uridylyltransferase
LLEYAFSGIHGITPSFFNLITSKGPFSIVDAYLSLCCRNSIKGYDVSNSFVLDVGKPDSIAKAEEYLKVRSEKKPRQNNSNDVK